ncbi:reverse transcriptase domain-containing protein [Tanacetum coccineum]
MKLNPKKCTFRMREGMFLGYKVNVDRLKVCLDKVEAVLSLPSLKCLKDVQRLNGKLASLSRFLSKIAKKSLPFFKTLKKCTKKSDFQWTAEAKTAFKQMKTLIAELPIRALQGPEIKYTPMEKLILALRPKNNPPDTPMEDKEELLDQWVLFTDGSSCIDGSEAGLILTNPEGAEFTYALRFRFDATNNEAEYEALIAGLRIAEQMGVKYLQENVDSRLVANQVNGSYIAKEPGMIKYLEKVRVLTSTFKEFSIKQVPRGENKKADALSKMASTSFAHLSKQVLVEELKEKSIDEKEGLAVVEKEGRTWMTPIHEYLTEEILPEEKRKARAICRKAGKLCFERNP